MRTKFAAALLSAAVAGSVLPGVAAVASAPSGDGASTSSAAARVTVTKSLRQLVAALPQKAEVKGGYKREKFTHWIDENGNCRDARAEVLRKESKKSVTGNCSVKTGRWVSAYDGKVLTKASQVHIDHVVSLKEAWDSGANKWNSDTRKRFANDLGDYRTLIAVSSSSNLSKNEYDAGQWLPTKNVCTYVHHVAAVKTRWSLSVSPREKRVLAREAKACKNVRIKVTKAAIGTGADPKPAPKPKAKPKPKPAPKPSGTDPRFGTCTEAKDYGYGPYVRGVDAEYGWYDDRDGDGWVCE